MIKRHALIFVALIFTIALTAPLAVQAQDLGEPDSLYFLSPTVELLNCSREVAVTIPVFLWTDHRYFFFTGGVHWEGADRCDSVSMQPVTPCYQCTAEIHYDSASQECSGFEMCDCSIGPGCGVAMRFFLHAHLGDTLSIEESVHRFEMGDYSVNWIPTFKNLDTFFVLPDTLAAATGDADCSGSVDISDAVFLITYIFAGGIPPYDMNAADENSDCTVDISDVVYLIAYIFSGGPTPQVGCVVP